MVSRAAFVRLTALLTILVLAVQAAWALVTPGFRGPDEPHHVNSIFRVASGNGWPPPGEAMLDSTMMEVSRQAALIADDATGFTLPERRLLVEPGRGLASFYDAPVVPQPQRTPIGEVAAADPDSAVRDQMTQHPPLYYASGAAVVRALDLDQMPWDRALLALRLFSILWTAPLVPCLVYAARRLGAAREWALLAGLLPVGIPQVTAINAVVSNDAAAVGLGALALVAMVKAATEPVTRRSIILVGALTGAALWTKGQLLALGLPLILVFLLHSRTGWKLRVGGALGAGVVSQVVCPWWVLNLLRYGALQPDGFQREPRPGWDPSQADAAEFARASAINLSESLVARFGWHDVTLPLPVTVVLLAVLVVLTVVGLVMARRNLLAPLAIHAAALGLLVILLRESWLVYQEVGVIAGLQGRYFFPFLLGVAVIPLALSRAGRTGYVGFALAMVLMNVVGVLALLRGYFPGLPVDFGRMSAVLGFGGPKMLGLLAGYALVVLALAVVAATVSRRFASKAR